MKKCPYCLSEVSGKAIKCKHCGEFLSEGDRKDVSGKDNKEPGINSKFWRAMIVIYFLISIPITIAIYVSMMDDFGPYYGSYYSKGREWGNTILWTILIPLIYLIATDILRGAVYYIVRGKYELYIWKKLRPFIKKIIN